MLPVSALVSLVLLTFTPSISYALQGESPFTVQELKAYQSKIAQIPVPKNQLAEQDVLLHFYEKQQASWLSRLSIRLGIKKPRPLGPRFLTKLLDSITTRLIKTSKEDKVAYLSCAADTTFIVYGNIQSSLSTLTHSILWLHEQGIIDDHFTIIKKNHYLIFNGNMVGTGTYGIETLSLILLLMERNPDTVIYLSGTYEYENFWYNARIKQQLIAQAKNLSQEAVPLTRELTNFFSTLPLALYISINEKLQELLCLVCSSLTDVIINPKLLGSLFSRSHPGVLKYHNLADQTETTVAVDVIACIVNSSNPTDARPASGLGLIDPYEGATTWAIISRPLALKTETISPPIESFIVIKCKDHITNGTITHYKRSTTGNDPFKEVGTYYLIGGNIQKDINEKAARKDTISLGSSISLIQGVPVMGQLVKRGASLCINEANQTNGIHGSLMRFTIYNDDYIPYRARENIHKLAAEGTDIILVPVGSPTLSAYLDDIRKNSISVFFPITGAPAFRDPSLKGLIHLRGQYSDEVYALLTNLMENYNVKKFAFFYQDDSYGTGPLEAATAFLRERGITEWAQVPYSRANTDFSLQAKTILEAQPEAIGFFATAQAGEALIREIGIENCVARHLFGISFFAEETFRRFTQRHGIPVMYGAVVPNPKTSQLPIALEYRKAMDTISKHYDVFSFESYMATNLLVHIMNQIKPPITRKKIMAQLEQLKDYSFKGLTLTFNPKTRSLAEHIWIETGEDKEWPRTALDSLMKSNKK